MGKKRGLSDALRGRLAKLEPSSRLRVIVLLERSAEGASPDVRQGYVQSAIDVARWLDPRGGRALSSPDVMGTMVAELRVSDVRPLSELDAVAGVLEDQSVGRTRRAPTE